MFGKSSHTDPFIATYSVLVVFYWAGFSLNFSYSTHHWPPLVLYPCFIFLHGSHHSLTLFACDLSFPIRAKQRWHMSHFFLATSTNLEINLLVYSRCLLVEWNNFYIVVLPSLRNLALPCLLVNKEGRTTMFTSKQGRAWHEEAYSGKSTDLISYRHRWCWWSSWPCDSSSHSQPYSWMNFTEVVNWLNSLWVYYSKPPFPYLQSEDETAKLTTSLHCLDQD